MPTTRWDSTFGGPTEIVIVDYEYFLLVIKDPSHGHLT